MMHRPRGWGRSVRHPGRGMDAGATIHPGQLVIAGFVLVITLGTSLLSLPVAREDPEVRVSLFDALFTAVASTTVSGMAVVEVGSTFSTFGEIVILIMIQIGGLGIMTVASVATVFLTRRLGIRRGLLTGTEIGMGDFGELRPVVRSIFRFTLFFEITATLLLTARFWIEGGRSVLGSLYLGAFHAITAFNNAGVSPLADNLTRYVTDPWVNLIIAGTIIGGGIGFPVAVELRHHWRTPRTWSLHTKLTLVATALLLVVGTLALLVIEWANPATMGELSAPQKLLAGFFQSVTTRTAGFNTLDVGELRSGSILLMLLFMTIGASSASTSGGIKTSTFIVVLWTTLAEFRGDREVTIFGRRLPSSLQRQALAMVVAALGGIGTTTFLMSLTQPELELGSLLFEVTAAFGTTGLSTGITPDLNSINRVMLMGLMFVGRVGPVTFGTAMLFRSQPQLFRYPEEKILIG